MVLFQEDIFLHLRFPERQYFGAKNGSVSWIACFVPKQARTAIDASAGSQSVAFYLKQRGLRVFTNDFLAFNHAVGKALIENETVRLPKSAATELLPADNSDRLSLIKDIRRCSQQFQAKRVLKFSQSSL